MKPIIGALIGVLVLSGCSTQNIAVQNIGDSQVTLPIVNSGETPAYSRVVALANGSAEIVAALGFTKILVGRDIASTMPELSKIPIDTDAHQVSVERVLSQHPDLILIDSNTSPASAITVLRNSGIKIVTVPNSWTLTTMPSKEAAVSDALKVPQAQKMLQALLKQNEYPSKKIKVAFLYLRGTASIYLIGGKGSGADSLLTNIGFIDAGAAVLPHPFNALTAEALIKLQPDVLLLMTKGLVSVGGLSGLIQLPGIAQTPAGKNKRVITVDDSLLLSFGPRTISLLPKLRAAILKVSAQ